VPKVHRTEECYLIVRHYGAGLRVSEVVALKVGDIDSERMLLRVEQGKGRKDRDAMLSPQLLELLRDWWVMGWTPPDGILCQGDGVELPPKEASVEQASTIGLDIAKHVFQVHGADAAGHVLFRRHPACVRTAGCTLKHAVADEG
jgi:hypothetical protein